MEIELSKLREEKALNEWLMKVKKDFIFTPPKVPEGFFWVGNDEDCNNIDINGLCYMALNLSIPHKERKRNDPSLLQEVMKSNSPDIWYVSTDAIMFLHYNALFHGKGCFTEYCLNNE